ncbi:MAG: M23 family metallopeptidase [Holosporales bacterium]|jgi:murein DD-endopeptidase MepM/ murein hydrolase activator NlpD|nr:M23 family metallopeptidase [Holosporales bacterium]
MDDRLIKSGRGLISRFDFCFIVCDCASIFKSLIGVGLGRGLLSLGFRRKLIAGSVFLCVLLVFLGDGAPTNQAVRSVKFLFCGQEQFTELPLAQKQRIKLVGRFVAGEDAAKLLAVSGAEIGNAPTIAAQLSSEGPVEIVHKSTVKPVLEGQGQPTKLPLAQNQQIKLTDRLIAGENIAKLLVRNGIGIGEACRVSSVLKKALDLKKIPAGRHVFLDKTITSDGNTRLNKIAIDNDFAGSLEVYRVGSSNQFKLNKKPCDLVYADVAVRGVVRSNLSSDILAQGVPAKIVAQITQALNGQIDFRRSVKRGDKFELIYETVGIKGADTKRAGNLKFINLVLRGRKVKVYGMRSSGACGYFDEAGNSLEKNIMRSPIDGGRISSRFGRRAHPISGRLCRHNGVDIAANLGAVIHAASNGRVAFVGQRPGYGRVVCLSHQDGYSTLYAHMSKFAAGIQPGAYVTRGQAIGRVGVSGSTTGPHVHFEVIKNGAHLNPLLVGVLPGKKLSGKDLAQFKKLKASVESSLRKADL